MEKKSFLISVVIPIYNISLYLEEAINSVINQTIGFNNIELILVNDGSTDNSEKICLKYLKKYPDNVKYIKQNNAGVSNARNNGMKIATGKYINFLDGDDYWENDAFSKAITFIDNNTDINFVSVRNKLFGDSNKFHCLDYKYDYNKVVNIMDNPKMLQTSTNNVIFNTSFVKHYKYEEGIRYSEDVRFISIILMDCKKYGLIADSLYHQRKRIEKTSATQVCCSDIRWYYDTINLCYNYLKDESIKRFNCIIDYIQYVILYEFQWRFFTDRSRINITKEETKKYFDMLVNLLKKCEDKNILSLPMSNDFKMRKMLEIKYDGSVYEKLVLKKNNVFLKDTLVCNINDLSLRVENIYVKDNNLNINLVFNTFVTKNITVTLKNGYQKINLTSTKRNEENKVFYDYIYFNVDTICCSIPLKNVKNISFYNNDFAKMFKYKLLFSKTVTDSVKEKGYYERNNIKFYIKNDKIKVKY